MKKIMIAAFAALTGTSTLFGANVTWKITNIAQYNDDSAAVASGSKNYLIMFFSSSDGNVNATFNGTGVSAGTDTLIGTSTISGAGGLTGFGKAVGWDSYGAGSYYYAVICDSKNTSTQVAATSYDYYGVSDILTGNPVAGAGETKLSLTWTPTTYGMTTLQSVPEPSSAMLLLLGFAGLALRRKQK